jgi:hypothetical protein
MVDFDLKEILFQELGYTEDAGLETYSTIRANVNSLPNIDNVYYVQNIPVAYFTRVSESTFETVSELLKSIWNESRVPLLYLFLPNEIKIYNCYLEPANDNEELTQEDRLLRNLTELVDVQKARQAIQKELYENYNRMFLETGGCSDQCKKLANK